MLEQIEVGGRKAWVCGTCATNLAVYQRLLAAGADWPTRRSVGN